MNIILVPFFSGLLLVVFLFAISFSSVIAVKWAYLKLLELFPKRKTLINNAPSKKTTKPRKLKPPRSVEINPDEIDRIYVKKIS